MHHPISRTISPRGLSGKIPGLAVAALLLGTVSVFSLGVIVPAYFYPSSGSPWTELNTAARRIPLVAIMNPNNGPGTTVDSRYTSAVANLQAAGGKVIGYVYSSYTSRALAEVQADISKYLALYPSIDGFFVDEMTNDSLVSHQTYYLNLKAFILGARPGALIVGNPGTRTLSNYLAAADTLVTFENGTGYSSYVPDAWTLQTPASAISHLCYAIGTAGGMSNCVQLAVARNVGWVFVTDDLLPNPWDTLPPYWTAEVGLIESLNRPKLSIRRAGDEVVELVLQAAPGTYVTENSNDLATWAPLATNLVPASGSLSLRFTNNAAAPARFHRARFVFW